MAASPKQKRGTATAPRAPNPSKGKGRYVQLNEQAAKHERQLAVMRDAYIERRTALMRKQAAEVEALLASFGK